jgi:hypothetical protein
MDVAALHECFAATLSADQQRRQHAEQQLRVAETKIGFLGACLDILSNDQVQPGVKTAAAVFFKNRIVRYWARSYSDSKAEHLIDNDEKPIIRDRLLETLVECSPQLRKQLIPVLSTITTNDYPKEWPNLVDNALKLLYVQNLASAHTGLLCFAEVCSSFRWVTNDERPELDALINTHFPTLLQVADSLLKEESQEAGEMTVLILKIFKYSTYHDLPVPLQIPGVFGNWASLHVAIINQEIPQYVLNLDESERRLNPWVKAKKWAYANLYRLFTRYASSSLSKRFTYTEFRNLFVENLVPQLLNLYFSQIELWCSSKLWIGEEPLYYLISFLENSITQKKTWELIKPHYEILISNFIFPLLCPSDKILDDFENDPENYIHTKLDIYDDNNSPDLAAISLLITLTTKKKKTTLEKILHFSFTLLNQYKTVNSLDEAKKLEGALRLIGSLSDHFTNEKSPYYPQMEEFLASLIIPHLNNSYSFIRARSCEIISKFSDIEFSNDSNLGNLYNGVLTSFNDENIPVKLEASLAIQSFVKVPKFQEALSSVIVDIMRKLLQLSNEIDAEVISGVMQELVEVFSEQLQPFGVELMNNLVEQFMRLAKELNDAANVDPDDIEGGGFDDLSDKQMAALGLLNTMITVLLSFESSNDVVFKLEEVFFPVVQFVFGNNIEDFFREAGELIENSTFLTRRISEVGWRCFELIIYSLTNGIAILYFEDLMPALNNFLCYGSEVFKTNERYTSGVLRLFQHVLSSEDVETNELGYGGEIMTKLNLSLGPLSEPFIEDVLSRTINAVIDAEVMPNVFSINMINVIITGLIYHPQKTLNILSKGNFTLPFFNLWFRYISNFKRVFDLKLSTLGLLSLISLPNAEFEVLQVSTLVPQFGQKLAILMEKLPDAIQELEKRRKEFDGDATNDNDAFDYATYDGGDDDDEWENEDVDDDGAAGDDYMNFLAEEAKKLESTNKAWGGENDDEWDDDEDLIEDALANTILDNVNVFSTFKEAVLRIKGEDPVKYQVVFGGLNGDEQAVLQNVLEF